MKGVMFGDKHSYRDFGLFLHERPKISPPKVKKIQVDIPGSDGVIDLTESLTGDVKFENRNIECSFTVIDNRKNWDYVYSDVMDYLHGRRMKIIFDEDPSFYYIGRIEVDEWKSEKAFALIVIKCDVEAYKLERFGSLEDWEWDTFDFETGIIREYKNLIVEEELIIKIPERRKYVVPVFEVTKITNELNVTFSGKTFRLETGRNIIPYIEVKEGNSVLKFTGKGIVSIDYRGGRL